MGKYKRKGPTNQTTHISNARQQRIINDQTIKPSIYNRTSFYMRASAPRKLNNIEFTDRLSYSRLESH